MSKYKFLGRLNYVILGLFVIFLIIVNFQHIFLLKLDQYQFIIFFDIFGAIIFFALFTISKYFIMSSRKGYNNGFLNLSFYSYIISSLFLFWAAIMGIIEEFSGRTFFRETLIIPGIILLGVLLFILSIIMLAIGYSRTKK